MKLKQLFADDDAVSPVIGVILMVAITVILAAVIGTFVLGLGDQVQSTAPNAQFSFDYNQGDTTDDSWGDNATGTGEGLLEITHDGGDGIDAARLSVSGSSINGSAELTANATSYSSGDTVSAGDGFTYAVADGDTARIIWTSQSGDSSSTVGRWSGPAA